MTSSARMLEFIDFIGIKKSNFYKQIGLSNGYLDKVSELGSDKIASILKFYPNINLKWLITGDGNMTTEKVLDNNVPIYNVTAAAGDIAVFNNITEQIPMGFISVPNLPKCDGAISITGDSMYPLLKAGDYICYKRINDPALIAYGRMYVVDFQRNGDDYLMVKYIKKGPTPGSLLLISANKHHDDIEITQNDVRSLALVKLSLRYEDMV